MKFIPPCALRKFALLTCSTRRGINCFNRKNFCLINYTLFKKVHLYKVLTNQQKIKIDSIEKSRIFLINNISLSINLSSIVYKIQVQFYCLTRWGYPCLARVCPPPPAPPHTLINLRGLVIQLLPIRNSLWRRFLSIS